MRLPRRHFLKNIAAAGGVVAVPAVLGGCASLNTLLPEPAAPAAPPIDGLPLNARELERVLATLGARGADFGEIYFQDKRVRQLACRDGECLPAAITYERGAGLRVVRGEESGFAATEALEPATLQAAAASAATGLPGVAAADGAMPVAPDGLSLTATPGYYAASPWMDTDATACEALLLALDAAARAADARVSAVRAEWVDEEDHVIIATLDGRLAEDRRPLSRLSLEVDLVAGGQTNTGFASLSTRAGLDAYNDSRLRELAALAVHRAGQRSEARLPPLGELPVVLQAGSAGILLHEAVGHAFEADMQGPLPALPGERVANDFVRLVDTGSLRDARGALNIDDEGERPQAVTLVDNGRVAGALHDRQSALRTGAQPTGSARRESYQHEPLPRMRCFYLDNGPHEREEVLAAVERGILAESFTGGQVDAASGAFRFHLQTGWLLENGQPTFPVRDLLIEGDARSLLAGIRLVGNDRAFAPGGWTCGKRGQRVPVSVGQPTTLVEGLRVGAATG